MVNAAAQARLEMARERARIAEKRPALPSRLERAAHEWRRQQEQQERLRFQAGPETSVVALQRMPLRRRASDRPAEGGFAWKPLPRGDEAQPKQVTLNAAMVTRIAQHLKATEWARAMGRKTSMPLGPDLEGWAERWKRTRLAEGRQSGGSAE